MTGAALIASELRFHAVAAAAPVGIVVSAAGASADRLDLGFASDRAVELCGVPRRDLLGDRWLDCVLDADRELVRRVVAEVFRGDLVELAFRLVRPDGELRSVHGRFTPCLDGAGRPGFVAAIEDRTFAEAREAEAAWQARHDPLTGLPNRTELAELINDHLSGDSGRVSLLLFDLDDFKLVNDSLGHAAGDALLQVVAERLQEIVRDRDVVARFGGDEFVVFCPSIDSRAQAKNIADRVITGLRAPIDVAGRQIRVTASAGVVVSEVGHGDAESLIRDVDVALYQAKAAGKARAAFFDAEVRRGVEHRLDVVSDLRRALAEGDVDVYYQPIFRHGDLSVIAAEALLRYTHRTLGPIPATDVIATAEASGCIDELGFYVLERACADLAAWRRRMTNGYPDYITVNLAATQLGHPDFEDSVHRVLDRHGLVAADLCLELTESQLMTDVATAERVLGSLAEFGVRLAIDDFGTGYSSLAYLRRFPVSLVKIERSFVSDPHDPFVAAIVEAVVAVTQAIGGQVVAEGVETMPQLRAIGDLGCSLIQGYLLGRPMPAAQLPLSVFELARSPTMNRLLGDSPDEERHQRSGPRR